MSPIVISAIGLFSVLALSALRVPIAVALGLVGAIGTGLLKGTNTFVYVAGTAPFQTLNNYSLSVLPLFILMGAFAVRAGLSTSLVRAANAFVGHYRGGLAMGSVAACAGFGAISHSDLATLTTMTRITIPEMLRLGYHPRLAAGALAAGATLAILMPPSVPMIVYSYMTQTSLGRLYAGAIIPVIVLTVLHLVVIHLWVRHDPSVAPKSARSGWRQRFDLSREIVGLIAVVLVVMFGIYLGFFSPTEAGAVGAAMTLALALFKRQLSWSGFVASVRDTVHFSAIIYLLTIGIALFHFFMDSAGLPKYIADFVIALHMSPTLVMASILGILMLLGTVIEAIAILFITTPFLYPIIVGLGFDPVWFGVVMMMIVELGLIIPPLGLNVFLLTSMIKEISLWEAFRGCAPFVAADVLMVVFTFRVPGVVTWLPGLMH
jgi:tripartite ATP-independent transporter DctM subunit